MRTVADTEIVDALLSSPLTMLELFAELEITEAGNQGRCERDRVERVVQRLHASGHVTRLDVAAFPRPVWWLG